MLARIVVALVSVAASALAQSPQWALSPVSYPVNPAGGLFFIIVGDVNLDGRADVVGVGSPGVPSTVLLGQVGGGLQQVPGTPIGGVTGSPRTIGDIDNDGLPDLVMENVTLKGMGDGTFGAPLAAASFMYPTGFIASCALGDVNGDGLGDVAFTTTVGSTSELRIALGKTGGGYYLPLSWAIGGPNSRVFASEATGDAYVDFVVGTPSGFGIASRSPSGTVGVQAYARGSAQVAAELTGDQWPDIYSPSSPLAFGSGGGLFTQGPSVPLLGSPTIAFNADGDGIFDLVAPTYVPPSGTALVIARSLGSGSFDTSCVVAMPSGVSYLAAADVLGDSRPEVIAFESSSPSHTLRFLVNLDPDCNHNGIDDPVEITNGWVTDCDANGVPDSCQSDCDNSGTPDVCQIAAQPSLDLNSNGRLDSCEYIGTNYCFGDGTGAACPCDPGQAGPVGGGCKNSNGGGGRFRVVGNAQVSADSLTMTANGMDATAIGMLFQGTASQAAGQGSAFGDGLLCVNGTIVRMIIRSATAGSVSYGNSVADLSLASIGMVPPGGATRFYQVWYRDSASFCTAATYNMTNGVEIAWQP